jgi:toxin ParE1/3/4
MIFVIAEAAEADLERIADTIAQENPRRALTFVQELRQRCEQLADVPKGFPLVPRYEHTGMRRRVHGNYLIFYRVGSDIVEVIHILHGAMDYEPLLFLAG